MPRQMQTKATCTHKCKHMQEQMHKILFPPKKQWHYTIENLTYVLAYVVYMLTCVTTCTVSVLTKANINAEET